MGLYHSVALGYGFEIPADTDIDAIDRACFGQEDGPDGVGYIVVGDRDQLLIVTRHTKAVENTVTRITADMATADDLTRWNVALHAAAARLGLADHEPPGWLLIHNYR
ncbi:hypothetical protein GCM10010293_40000 [Streptomyces griseoflavus]|uniref:hypothetical protein n=1 Tax=Streptomyces griseoflavus TaxID=35619 RepID=UPI00167CA0B8|nr:hypothetical protein [Streptomyces griseoflavus]GGV36636.1 hypothetical protein GCM10010293_40000 [Streptomyces griseoflavus]